MMRYMREEMRCVHVYMWRSVPPLDRSVDRVTGRSQGGGGGGVRKGGMDLEMEEGRGGVGGKGRGGGGGKRGGGGLIPNIRSNPLSQCLSTPPLALILES